jgi:hypothetical protein
MASERSGRLQRLVGDLRTAATMPRLTIVLSRGGEEEEAVLERFRRRHPRYRIVASKAVGVALVPLDDISGVDDYLAGLRYARRRVRRAARLGYVVDVFDPDERRDELLAIHASLPERQGRPIDPEYLDPEAVHDHGPDIEHVGVFLDGAVVAYSRLDYLGEIAGMGRIMGHGDHLENGVMFLLTAEIVGHVKATRPGARYLFYDMFFGAPDGLRAFKTNLGFRPYYVHWTREPARPAGGS